MQTKGQDLREAIASYDGALHRAPDDITALNNKGLALQSLGELQARLAQHDAAQISWQAALELVSRSLQLVPNSNFMMEVRDQLQALLDEYEQD